MNRILLIEDSAASAMLYEARLNRTAPDMQVHVRRSWGGAMDEMKKGFKPTIVIIDLGLPDSSPEETISRLNVFKPAKVLAMSAEGEYEKLSLANGADDYMAKVIGESTVPFMERVTRLLPK